MDSEEEVPNSSSQDFETVEIDPEMLIGGTKVNYFIHCKTQLWLFSYYICMERESELVAIGKILESVFFREERLKNVMIDLKISLDFVKSDRRLVVKDVKKSSKFEKAHYYQMVYYLWYLKNIKGVPNVEGVITYPKEKRVVTVKLEKESEKEIEDMLEKIREILAKEKPPLPTYKKYCRKCAYFEFCFGDT